MNFIAIAQSGFDAWAAKPHNKKWFRRVDGTPIPNDVVVCIAQAFSEAKTLYLHLSPSPEQGEETAALACLEELSNRPLGISLEEWCRLSGPILGALQSLSALRARVAELEARATPQALPDETIRRDLITQGFDGRILELVRLARLEIDSRLVNAIHVAVLDALSNQGSSSND